MKRRKNNTFCATLSILSNNSSYLNTKQFDLMKAIQECGSISAAAKQVGISYKTAWDRVEALNNISDKPLVKRSSGGAKGGGTSLTKEGENLLRGFRELQELHQEFLERMGEQVQSLKDVEEFVKRSTLVSSARNQFAGEIEEIKEGAVNTEIKIGVSPILSLFAMVEKESFQEMNLKQGDSILSLVKSSLIILAPGPAQKLSTRNALTGTVSRVVKGAVNSQVSIDLGENKTITAIITNESQQNLGIEKGKTATAYFKASSVILLKG